MIERSYHTIPKAVLVDQWSAHYDAPSMTPSPRSVLTKKRMKSPSAAKSKNSMKPNLNTSIAMPIHITPHHLTLSPSLSRFVCGNIAKLPRFAGDAVAADIVLRRHHGTAKGKSFSASARLALPGHDVHATVTHLNLYTAITKLTKKLARRSLKRKTRRARASKRLHPSLPSNRPALLRDALERWAEVSTEADLEDAFIPVPEATSLSVQSDFEKHPEESR